MLYIDDKNILEDIFLNPTLEKLFYPHNYINSNSTDQAYAVSNEALRQYFKMLIFEGMRVATVGSSGDQLLNAILYGCRDVTVIDANLFARPYIEYKIAMIRAMDYDEFKNTFNYSDMFYWKNYAMISRFISPEMRHFWDPLMLDQEEPNAFNALAYFLGVEESERKLDCEFIFKSMLQHTDGLKADSEFYRDRNAYDKLRNILNNEDYKINFITATFEEFPDKLQGTFDFFFLSNIYSYIYNKEQFNAVVERLYNEKLNEGGSIQVHYKFAPYSFYDSFPKKIAGCEPRYVATNGYLGGDRAIFIDKPRINTHSELCI